MAGAGTLRGPSARQLNDGAAFPDDVVQVTDERRSGAKSRDHVPGHHADRYTGLPASAAARCHVRSNLSSTDKSHSTDGRSARAKASITYRRLSCLCWRRCNGRARISVEDHSTGALVTLQRSDERSPQQAVLALYGDEVLWLRIRVSLGGASAPAYDRLKSL